MADIDADRVAAYAAAEIALEECVRIEVQRSATVVGTVTKRERRERRRERRGRREREEREERGEEGERGEGR